MTCGARTCPRTRSGDSGELRGSHALARTSALGFATAMAAIIAAVVVTVAATSPLLLLLPLLLPLLSTTIVAPRVPTAATAFSATIGTTLASRATATAARVVVVCTTSSYYY